MGGFGIGGLRRMRITSASKDPTRTATTETPRGFYKPIKSTVGLENGDGEPLRDEPRVSRPPPTMHVV